MEIKPIVRNAHGLVEGTPYVLDERGRIDWRKMILPEYLVPNKRVFEKNQKEIPKSIEGLQDNELLILLGGIKDLANLRGYIDEQYEIVSPSPDYVVAVCSITWIANFETEGRTMQTSGVADAHPGNTDGFGKFYLAAIAENRAFVRCVRKFLRINIVGQDEVNEKTDDEVNEKTNNTLNHTAPAATSPTALLEKLMNEKNVSFANIKTKLITENVDGAGDYQSIADIPKVKIFELIERLRKKKP